MTKQITITEKLLQEKCGIVAIYTPHLAKQLSIALLAAAGVQHRGQHGAGIALGTANGMVNYKAPGRLDKVFTEELIAKNNLDQDCKWIIVHCRYGTEGGYGPENIQPCIVKAEDGTEIAVAHNGQFVVKTAHELPDNYSDTLIFTQKLAQARENSWEERVVKTLEDFRGAYSLVIGIGDKLFVARDEQGIRPLVLGRYNGGWIAASETTALNKVGAKVEREVRRGEIIRIDEGGLTVLRTGLPDEGHFCDFEWAYFARPDSQLPVQGSWLSIGLAREKAGEIAASEIKIPNASFVVGVPDSGIALATGFSRVSGIPFRQVIVRDHFDPNGLRRTFMQDHAKHKIRDLVRGKLSLIRDEGVWKDAVVVVCDDSIVRGDVSTQITKAMRGLGAKEIHWVSGYPQVQHRCHLGVSMRTKEELIASRNDGDVKKIAGEIGADSVNYISHSGFVRSRRVKDDITIPKDPDDIFLVNGGCGGCVTGRYPISKEGEVWKPS